MENEENKLIPPVSVGDILKNQDVISEGKKGEGVIKYEGYILFIEGAKEGDTVDVKVEKILPKFGIGIKINEVD